MAQAKAKRRAQQADTAPASSPKRDEFIAQLKKLIVNPPQGSVPMIITPMMAGVMLERNTRNRNVSPHHFKKLAKQMAEKQFPQTGEPIIFSSKGVLLNGQHRLIACVQAGVNFTCDVRFGIADEAFAYMDQGKKRTTANIFAIYGVDNYSAYASATRLVMMYYNNDLASVQLSGTETKAPQEIYEYYLQHPKLADSFPIFSEFKKSKLAPPSIMMALHYICARRAAAEADVFFHKIGTGLNFGGKKDPAYRLYQLLIKNGQGQKRLRPQTIAA